MKRRQFLGNVSLGAGSVLLSPVIRQVAAHADGGRPPMRFVFVLESNGRPPRFLQPDGIDWTGWRNDTLTDQPIGNENTLPRGLQPLEPYRDRLTLIQGLSGRVCHPASHSANFGALGCYGGKGGAHGETIDAALGRALPATFPQLVLGISKDPRPGVIYNCSATAAGKPLPTLCRPDLAYGSIFGSVAGGTARQEFVAQRNLLDFMVDDIRRHEAQLGGQERQKFQQHLQAFESLRDRQSRLNEIEHTLRRHAPVLEDKYLSDVETDRLDAHFDLGAAALISGLTNVLTIASGTGSNHMSVRFSGLGIEVAKHELGHGASDRGRTADECLDIIRGFHMELIVRMMKRLDAVPEGDGTMLDNTLFVFLSDAGEMHHPWFREWPVLLIGNLGGRLKAGGRFLGYPGYGQPGHRTMANLFLTLLETAAAPRETFGRPDDGLRDLDQTGPLAELLVPRFRFMRSS